MICQEVLDKAQEEEDNAGSEEWSFVGMAALIASNLDAKSNDDLCPSLLALASPNAESRDDTNEDSDDHSMPKLAGRKCCESDSDAEFDEDGDSIPGLITRHNLDSDSDDELKNENWESKNKDSEDNSTCRTHFPDLAAVTLTLMLSANSERMKQCAICWKTLTFL
jgi:hypothetical protein